MLFKSSKKEWAMNEMSKRLSNRNLTASQRKRVMKQVWREAKKKFD